MEYNKLSAPLKIALVLDDYYPSSSGVSRSIQSQIDELSAMGHQVTLIAPEKNFTPPKNAEHIALKSVQPPGALKHTTVLSSSAHVAKLIIKNHQFDIIHSQTDTGALILSADKNRFTLTPKILYLAIVLILASHTGDHKHLWQMQLTQSLRRRSIC